MWVRINGQTKQEHIPCGLEAWFRKPQTTEGIKYISTSPATCRPAIMTIPTAWISALQTKAGISDLIVGTIILLVLLLGLQRLRPNIFFRVCVLLRHFH